MTSETIVAVYNDSATAQQAVAALRDGGISAQAIDTYSSDRYQTTRADPGYITPGSGSNTAGGTGERREGFWTWLFGENESAADHSVYDRSLQGGGTVVTVVAQAAESPRVMEILERFSPVDIEEHATARGPQTPTAAATPGAGVAGADAGARTASPREAGGGAMTLSEEQLVVGKREVERGRARLRKYVVSRPVEEQIRLREETVRVFRRPVSGEGQVPADAFADRTVEVREMAEEPVVGKTARVVEEVGLEKQVGERTETIRDTVRREEIEVQGVNDRGGAGTAGARPAKV